MILQSWAERLCDARSSPGVVGLHVMDTVTAFIVGLKTSEGQEIARIFARNADPAVVIAAVAANARLSECDDIHLASCVTPGSVVIPVALSLAKDNEERFHRAVATGYAAAIALGLAIGGTKALGGGVWPTLLAAPLMAAVTASCARGHDAEALAHAMALALKHADGCPSGAPFRRWVLFAQGVASGIAASDEAAQGLREDLTLFSKTSLAAWAGHDAIDLSPFESTIPSIADVGFKPFSIARQGLNAVIAFQRVLTRGIDPEAIDSIDVFVPAMNVALLTRPVADDHRLSRLCNMGFQLACAALAPELLYDAQRSATAPLLDFASRVCVAPARDLETHLPNAWAARVVVKAGQARFEETVIRTDFDAGAPYLAASLRDKWSRLAPGEAISPGSHAELWQQIEARVTMAARREG
jgi:2-methylcitrate dehydratase PrpD